jgi:hypothetical protein
MANTYQFDDFQKSQNPNCVACEELLTDAIDGLLSAADREFFDRHLTGCVPCMEKYADAQRGAAWLDLLKTQRPEPSAALLHRILEQTVNQTVNQAATAPAFVPVMPVNVIPFAPRPVSRLTRWTRLAMEPRLAMTAAMAFFSIALTMNLTGVRLDQLHASDLKPQNLRRSYYEANASAVRYYDNLRVVRVLESRVDDLRQSNEDDRPSHPTPESQPASQPDPKPDQKPAPKQDTPQGSSRRESPLPSGPGLLRSAFNPAEVRSTRLHTANSSFISLDPKQEGGLV